jgi:hypothetical protein
MEEFVLGYIDPCGAPLYMLPYPPPYPPPQTG